jgi:putative ABC transport system permease protein
MAKLLSELTNELGPIFRAAKRQRARTVVIILEVALTLAIAVNCINLILDMRRTMARPSGIDEENLLAVGVQPFAEEFRTEEAAEAAKKEDLLLLQNMPGVRSASGISQIPLSGSGSSTGRIPMGKQQDGIPTPYFEVTPEIGATLGYELIAGRELTPEDALAESGQQNVLVTDALAKLFYPDGDALGKQITTRTGTATNTIVGIIGHMANSWPESDWWQRVMLIPGQPGQRESYNFMIRVKPTRLEEVSARIEKDLLARHPGRLVSVMSMEERRADTFRESDAVIAMLKVVIVLLAAVTALGIAGLTSFSVTQRTQQIGTRRALGATRADILRLFLVENWVITSLGLVIGIAGCFALNYLLLQWADAPRLGLTLIPLGMLALWLTGLVSAFAPAWRATAISPVVATRSV